MSVSPDWPRATWRTCCPSRVIRRRLSDPHGLRSVSAGRPELILSADASLDPHGTQLIEELRAAAVPDALSPGSSRDNVEVLLTTSPPHVVQSMLAEELVYQAIKVHLLASGPMSWMCWLRRDQAG